MEAQTYFRDDDAPDIDGFTIIEESDDAVRIAEKRDGEWAKPYWMPKSELQERLDSGLATRVGTISSDQYMRVCQSVGVTA
jgi:hypothetical protein